MPEVFFTPNSNLLQEAFDLYSINFKDCVMQQSAILSYNLPSLQGISNEQILRIERSLLEKPVFKHLSVLPEPEILSEEEYQDREAHRQLDAQSKLPFRMIDMSAPNRTEELKSLLQERFSQNQGVHPEILVISGALRASADYAWTWQTALAACCTDHGVDVATSNRIAALFLNRMAEVNMEAHPHYAATQVAEVKGG